MNLATTFFFFVGYFGLFGFFFGAFFVGVLLFWFFWVLIPPPCLGLSRAGLLALFELSALLPEPRVGPKPVLAGPAGKPGSGPGRPRFLLRLPDVCFFFPHYYFCPSKNAIFSAGRLRCPVYNTTKNTWLNMLLSCSFVFP